MAKREAGTYVYCLIAAPRAPKVSPRLRRPVGLGPVRLVPTAPNEWLAVSDAPVSEYNEAAINSRLGDLDAIARAAVAHEGVVESFIAAPAVLPMKLFTIFTNDDRAVEHVTRDRRRIDGLLRRVRNHHEWGVRVTLDRRAAVDRFAKARVRPASRAKAALRGEASGLAYLVAKKARRDSATELAQRARNTVAAVYEQLSRGATLARRRTAAELPADGGALLLDAAFLVQRSKASRFRAQAAREARGIEPDGYRLTVTGPWPPYTFIQD